MAIMSKNPLAPARSLSFEERAVGAFLGLAYGDAFGEPLEFVRGPAVRTHPVDTRPGAFRWTDDTHMALYLAEALLDPASRAFEGAPDDDALGHAIAAQFVRWADDPLTPSTAPGGTCLAGVAAYRRSRDWRTSGVPTSDGCGAVMRIAPLPMALAGEALTRAADISSRVTHAHPNALEAAIAASHLLRALLEGEALDEAWVRAAIVSLHGPWSRGGQVARSLEDAIVIANDGDAKWLDEDAVFPGDGGWRSGSALGLAIAAALRHRDDPTTAVERAARIEGDSDSVACLAGMFLGAVHGAQAFPSDALAALPERARIESLARELVRRATGG
jgi:ADP-ribosylglycohydrolase